MFNHQKYQAFRPINKADRQWPNQQINHAPLWCAVDLRDGNQALIEPMNVAQKIQMWQLLLDMGFKHIEVGFPSASQTDFDFVRYLIEENKIPEDVTIQALTQARDNLIERTYESLAGAKQAIVHVYNSTSPVQREKVFALDKQGIIDIAVNGAKKVQHEAKKHPQTQWTFQYSPESFSGTEVDFSVEVCNAVIDVWKPNQENKTIINLPATVECTSPNVFADQVEYFCENIKQRNDIIVSIHTHNDRGCAVAAAEMAILAGADRIEGTLMGNGERTGNMDIITMAMNLYSQGIDPELDLSDAKRITQTVEDCTQIPTHARHPWMGDLVYTAFSGSHQDAIKKCLAKQKDNETWDVAYLPIDPKDIGRDYQSVIRINSQSGKGGVAYILEEEFGISLPRWMQIEISQAVQSYSEKNQCEVDSQTIYQIFQQEFLNSGDTHSLKHYQNTNGSKQTLEFMLQHKSGEAIKLKGVSDGPINGFCHALSDHFGFKVEVMQYGQSTLPGNNENSDSQTPQQALACIHTQINGDKYVKVAVSEDSLAASFKAILKNVDAHLASQTMQ